MFHNRELYNVNCPEREYTLVLAVPVANSAVATFGDTLPSSLSRADAGELPALPSTPEPAADGDTLPNASAPDTVRAVVSTDVGDASSWSRRDDCIRGGGFSSCLSAGTRFLAAPPSTLRGYGWAGFLLGRGGGIWIAGAAAPAEVLLLPDDSLATCSTRRNSDHQKRR